MRTLIPYKNLFWDFYNPLDKKLKEKVDYVLQIIISVERISKKFFKHPDDGIYEICIEYKSDIYRIFSFQDEGRLIILLHGIKKKTQKTPRKELDRAKELRREYYEKK